MKKPIDGRTKMANRIERENKAKVKAFFEKYPEATKGDAVRVLGMTYNTVRKHLASILSED